MNNLVSSFLNIDVSEYPDLHNIEDDRLKIFWVLWVAKKIGPSFDMTSSEISVVLEDAYSTSIPRQKIQAILKGETKAISRKKRGGIKRYKIMQAGIDELQSSKDEIHIIEPSNAFSGIRKVEDILSNLKGDVLVCDPYIESRSLDYLAKCRKTKSIKLLTSKIQNQSSFSSDLKAFNSEHNGKLEVHKTTSKSLHDRYIVHDGGVLILGTSLNGLGKKQSIVVSAGQDIKTALSDSYNRIWANSSKL